MPSSEGVGASLRKFLRDCATLLGVFGIYGLAVWPTAAYLGYQLAAKEISAVKGLRVDSSTLIGRDFVSIWHGGRQARLSGAAAIYDRDAYRKSLARETGARGLYAFSYPPHMLMLAIPFGLINYVAALMVWSIGGLALFWWAARRWLAENGLPGWSVLLLPGTLVNLWAGHFGFLIGALMLIGLRTAATRPRASGAAFALMTVKPHLGVLVPIMLAMRRCRQAIAWAIAGTTMLVAFSIATLGLGGWRDWFGSTLAFQLSLIDRKDDRAEYIFMMPTVRRTIEYSVSSAFMVSVLQWTIAAIVLAFLVRLLRGSAPLKQVGLATHVATLLILPYLFHYDLVLLTLIALLVARQKPSRWYSPVRLVCGLTFLVPLTQVPLARMGYWVSAPIIVALFVVMAIRILREETSHALA